MSRHVEPIDRRGSEGGSDGGGQDSKQRGLSSSIGTHELNAPSGGDGQRHAGKRGMAAKEPGQLWVATAGGSCSGAPTDRGEA